MNALLILADTPAEQIGTLDDDVLPLVRGEPALPLRCVPRAG